MAKLHISGSKQTVHIYPLAFDYEKLEGIKALIIHECQHAKDMYEAPEIYCDHLIESALKWIYRFIGDTISVEFEKNSLIREFNSESNAVDAEIAYYRGIGFPGWTIRETRSYLKEFRDKLAVYGLD